MYSKEGCLSGQVGNCEYRGETGAPHLLVITQACEHSAPQTQKRACKNILYSVLSASLY